MQDIRKVYHKGDETTGKYTHDLQNLENQAEDDTTEEDTFGWQKVANPSTTMQQM